MIKVKATSSSNIGPIFREMMWKAQQVCNEMAGDVSGDIESAVASHKTGEHSNDISSGSIYVQFGTTGGSQSDYAAKKSEILAALKAVDGSRDRFNGKPAILPRLPLASSEKVKKSRVASLYRVVYFWEFGHNNKVTGNFEYDPVFAWVPKQYSQRFLQRFEGILGRKIDNKNTRPTRSGGGMNRVRHAIVRGVRNTPSGSAGGFSKAQRGGL